MALKFISLSPPTASYRREPRSAGSASIARKPHGEANADGRRIACCRSDYSAEAQASRFARISRVQSRMSWRRVHGLSAIRCDAPITTVRVAHRQGAPCIPHDAGTLLAREHARRLGGWPGGSACPEAPASPSDRVRSLAASIRQRASR